MVYGLSLKPGTGYPSIPSYIPFADHDVSLFPPLDPYPNVHVKPLLGPSDMHPIYHLNKTITG